MTESAPHSRVRVMGRVVRRRRAGEVLVVGETLEGLNLGRGWRGSEKDVAPVDPILLGLR